jgi:uncharacterized membrane protein required for colicin V production
MTPYDVAMVGVMVAGMIWGALRGITWQLASIASLVLGYAVAFPLSAELAPRFPGEPVVARGLALLVAYAGVAGGVFLAAWVVRESLRRWKFDAFDRHLGMLLGGAEGALLGVVATVIVISVAPQSRQPILMSPSGRLVGRLLEEIQPVLPGEVRDILAPFWAGPAPAGAQAARPVPPPPKWDRAIRRSAADLELERPEPRDDAPRGVPDDGTADPASLRGLLEEGSARLGRAIADELRRQTDRADQAYDPEPRRR